MKVGFFTSVDGWGGSEVYLRTLIPAVSRHGIEPVLFGIQGTRLCEEIAELGIPVVSWKGAAGGEPPGHATPREEAGPARARRRPLLPEWVKLPVGNVREAWAIRRLLRQHPVDVLHVNVHGYEAAGLGAMMAGIPGLAVYHIWPQRDPTAVRRCLIALTAHTYRLVVTPSEAAMSAWQRWCRLPSRRCAFVWNGVDLDRFGGHRRSGHDEVFRILAVGRLDAVKGFDVLIDAARRLCSGKVEICIAGEGPAREHLEQQLVALGLGKRVRLLGHVENVDELYRLSDCLVVSSHNEGCSLVLMEAMASGLPVVTTDAGPLPQINEDGVTGYVVGRGDDAALAEALERLMGDARGRLAMGEAARNRAEKLFDQRRMVEEMCAIYQRVARA